MIIDLTTLWTGPYTVTEPEILQSLGGAVLVSFGAGLPATNAGVVIDGRMAVSPGLVFWARATDASGTARFDRSAGGAAVIPVPVNTAVPTISGTAQVGQTLTASPGTWTNSPTGFTWQWNRNGVPISGATGSTRVVDAGAVGAVNSVTVTAINAGGASAPATSAATATIIAASTPVPVNTAVPTISGTAQVGQTLTASPGTWTNSPTGFTYQWNRNGVPISGATGSTRVVDAGAVGAVNSVTVTAINAGGSSAPATSANTATVVGTFVMPALSTAKYDGDSRTLIGGRSVSAGILSVQGGYGSAFNTAGLLQAVCGTKWLLPEGFLHAVGASTTLAQLERMKSLSIATSGNPAGPISQGVTDSQYSFLSDGLASVLTQPGRHVFSASVGVNDGSGASAAYYNNPSLVSRTLTTIAQIADDLGAAGKVWYTGVGEPRGRQLVSMESRTVTGGTCTATLTSRFTDGESFGLPGVIGVFASGFAKRLTKVASAPAQDQYTVTGGGVYVFGGTAPTTVFLNYNAQPATGHIGTNDAIRVVREWMLSNAANFTSTINSVNYGIPGLRFNRPHVRVWDSFAALVDPTTGAEQLSLPGTQDNLQLHGTIYAAYKTAVALKAAFDADYPSAPSLDLAPTRNNWYAARGTGAGTAFSGTLPMTMRTGFTGAPAPTILSINGVVIGSVNTGTGAITGTGITSGSLDFATGVWSISFATAGSMPSNAQLWFEQDIGTYNVATLTPGTQGRNLVNNGLMEVFTAVGTNLTVVSGTSSISTIPGASVPYGWSLSGTGMQAAITAATAELEAFADTSDGYPRFSLQSQGVHNAGATVTFQQTITSTFARVEGLDFIQAGAQVAYQKHTGQGVLYGITSSNVQSLVISGTTLTRQSSTGPQSVTSVGSRTSDGGTGMYVPDNLLTDAGGQFSAYRVTPLVDISDVTAFTTTQLNITVLPVANVPWAFRLGYGRAQLRCRSDVA